MPPDHSIRLDKRDCATPTRPESNQANPDEPVTGLEPWIFGQVLAEAQDEGIALVIYERQQTVYHLTVGRAM